MAENQMIRSQADRQYNEILARTGRTPNGSAGRRGRSRPDPERGPCPGFRSFTRSSPRSTRIARILNEKTTLVLSASSSLLKMLTEGVPPLKPPANLPSGRPNAASTAPDSPKDAKKDKQAVPLPKVSSLQGGR